METNILPHKKRRHDGNNGLKSGTGTQKPKTIYRDNTGIKGWLPNSYQNEPGYLSHQDSRHSKTNVRKDDYTWEIQINLIGKKVKEPMIHVCEICSLPILSYGRMIPCKHVFCFSCAKQADTCPRCNETMQRIEQCPFGSVWLCSTNFNCRRTYLSQRDLQAHINHRHSKPAPLIPPQLAIPPVSSLGPPINVPPPPLMPAVSLNDPFMIGPSPHPATSQQLPVPVSTDSTLRPSSNLITIPIQDSDGQSYPPPPPPGRPANQPLLFPPQSQIDPNHFQQIN